MISFKFDLFSGMASIVDAKVNRSLVFIKGGVENLIFSTDNVVALFARSLSGKEDISDQGKVLAILPSLAKEISKVKVYEGEVIFTHIEKGKWWVTVRGVRTSTSQKAEILYKKKFESYSSEFPDLNKCFPDKVSRKPSYFDVNKVYKLQKAVAKSLSRKSYKGLLIYIHHNGESVCPVSTFADTGICGIIMPLRLSSVKKPVYRKPKI